MTIKFNKDIYSPKAVAAAVRVFSVLADLKVKAVGRNTVVEIKNAKTPTDTCKIGDEFSNYVLFLMQK